MEKSNQKKWKETHRQMDNYEKPKIEKLSTSLKSEGISEDEVHVKVFHEDIFDTIIAVKNYGFHPMVVNIVDGNFPLQALKCGSSHKQCEIIRRTNYFNGLEENLFPMKPDDAIYSPKIILFKDEKGKTYSEVIEFSMVSIKENPIPRTFAVKDGNIMTNVFSNKAEFDSIKTIIDFIFNVAIEKNHDCIIMDSLGYNRDDSPIKDIATIINENIDQKYIPYVFISIKNDNSIQKDSTFLSFHHLIKRN